MEVSIKQFDNLKDHRPFKFWQMKLKDKCRLVWKEKDHFINRQKEERYNLKCSFSITDRTLNPTYQNISRKLITRTFHRKGIKVFKRGCFTHTVQAGEVSTFLCLLNTHKSKLKNSYRQLSVDLHSYDDTIIMKLRNCDSNGKQKKKINI